MAPQDLPGASLLPTFPAVDKEVSIVRHDPVSPVVSVRRLIPRESQGYIVKDVDTRVFKQDLPGEAIGPAVTNPRVAVWFGNEAGDTPGGVRGEPEGLAVLPVSVYV